MRSYLSIILAAIIFLSGCDLEKALDNSRDALKYQLIREKDGSIYRLNRETGTLTLVNAKGDASDKLIASDLAYNSPGSTEVPVSVPEAFIDSALADKLAEPKDLGKIRMPGEELNADLKISWREENIHYLLRIYPYSSLMEIYNQNLALYAQFIIRLYDGSGFLLKEIPVDLLSMDEIKDPSGKGVEVKISSSMRLSHKLYQDIFSYDIQWKLNSDLIPDKE